MLECTEIEFGNSLGVLGSEIIELGISDTCFIEIDFYLILAFREGHIN